MSDMTNSEPTDNPAQDLLERFQAIMSADLSEEEIAHRIKTDFTLEEQEIVTELILDSLAASESDRYFPDQAEL